MAGINLRPWDITNDLWPANWIYTYSISKGSPQGEGNPWQVIDIEIGKLLAKGVIVPTTHEEREYISPTFMRPRKDDTSRLILNLKRLNEHVLYRHFKMESLTTVLNMVKPGCFMASIDLKDAYHSVPIATEHHKYLKFQWQGKLYNYVCFPNGLAFCPRKVHS